MTTKNRTATNGVHEPVQAGQPATGIMVIPPVQTSGVILRIVGITPLIVCAWSHKAITQMLDKQTKKAKVGRPAKNPEEDYQNSLYKSPDGWTGVPAGGVKACLVNACRAVDGLPMTIAKRMIFVMADGQTESGLPLVKIEGEHKMHQNMVRIDNGGTTDIRFRAIYEKWSAELRIDFLENLVSKDQVCNLVELAGFVEGLCEWRPGSPKNNSGSMGRFKIAREE